MAPHIHEAIEEAQAMADNSHDQCGQQVLSALAACRSIGHLNQTNNEQGNDLDQYGRPVGSDEYITEQGVQGDEKNGVAQHQEHISLKMFLFHVVSC
ncbi:MAG: hypothetical protein H6592_02055 [Flavobacteriales bacterium]|nr:hypothetical protein [Flavobacteriales bacterium]